MGARGWAAATAAVVLGLGLGACSGGADNLVGVAVPESTESTQVPGAGETSAATSGSSATTRADASGSTTRPTASGARRTTGATVRDRARRTGSARPTARTTTTPTQTPRAVTLPRAARGYADAWVRAYGVGDGPSMSLYASADVHRVMGSRNGGPHWAFTGSQAIRPGETLVRYQRSTDGTVLGVVLDDGLVAAGARHAIVDLLAGPANSEWSSLVRGDELYLGGGSSGEQDGGGAAAPALPTDMGAYADAFVRAWGVGDRTTADRYADPTGMYLFTVMAVGGPDWTRVSVGGATVTYARPSGGNLVVVIDQARLAQGAPDAITHAYIE